jgi:hypothetical protein
VRRVSSTDMAMETKKRIAEVLMMANQERYVHLALDSLLCRPGVDEKLLLEYLEYDYVTLAANA